MKRVPLFWALSLLALSIGLIVFLYYPVGFSLFSSFVSNGKIHTDLFSILLKNSLLVKSMINSILLGAVVTLGCITVAFPLAWFSSRYKLRFQGLLTGFIMLPMILPPFVGAVGMKQFLSRFGTLNVSLLNIGIIDYPIDWLGTGFIGVALLQILHLFPIVYLNISAALANVDPALEEAAWNLGSSRIRFMRRILLPLIMPAIFAGSAIVFVWSVTDLGTPLVLEYRNVVAYQIYNMINDIHENPMGYALIVVLLAWVSLIYFSSKAFFTSHDVYGSGRAARLTSRKIPGIFVGSLITGSFVLVGAIALIPHLMVVLTSIADKWFMTAMPEALTINNYEKIASHPLTILSIRNSLFLSALAALLDIVIGIVAAYAIIRFRFIGRQFLDFSVMLPLALPGLVVAFGYVGAFSGTPIDPRVNPFPLLAAAYAVRRLPFMVRSMDAGLRQVSPAMEEAALNLGASHAKALVTITIPLVSSNIIAGAILVFTFAMLEVSDSLILAMQDVYYPVTKAIYALVNRIGDGLPLASALGVFAMFLLGAGFLLAGKILGKKMGELFRV